MFLFSIPNAQCPMPDSQYPMPTKELRVVMRKAPKHKVQNQKSFVSCASFKWGI
ncbi:hypothetical protein [Nostoc sp. CMAA1605]|uniref:hypothetical protein n=1 Tax=Nostoc sp. CMAA1605 TaxID=2055159 RepID=UPI001F291871|nr:hypothetical protein [Nostoc sp. CMAA1605]